MEEKPEDLKELNNPVRRQAITIANLRKENERLVRLLDEKMPIEQRLKEKDGVKYVEPTIRELECLIGNMEKEHERKEVKLKSRIHALEDEVSRLSVVNPDGTLKEAKGALE